MNTGDKDGKVAILCLTEKGAELANKLSQLMFPATVYVPERLQDIYPRGEGGAVYFFRQWRQTFAEVFGSYNRIICIMAAGIVVRSLSHLISSKLTDPGIVVVDEAGRFAISLLSGHMGGANRLAQEVADFLNGQAVITTATDVNNKTAVDLLAARMEAGLEPRDRVKLINRLLAEGRQVNLYSPFPIIDTIQSDFVWQNWPLPNPGQEKSAAAASIHWREPAVIISPYQVRLDPASECLQIQPRNLSVGIGCRRGVSYAEIRQAVSDSLDKFNLEASCVKNLATMDIKAEESGILQLALEMGIPLLTFTRAEIMVLNGSYAASDWVKEKVGVGGVCEPAARLAAQQGWTLVPKQKIGAVTISVAMEKSWWWVWDREIGNC